MGRMVASMLRLTQRAQAVASAAPGPASVHEKCGAKAETIDAFAFFYLFDTSSTLLARPKLRTLREHTTGKQLELSRDVRSQSP